MHVLRPPWRVFLIWKHIGIKFCYIIIGKQFPKQDIDLQEQKQLVVLGHLCISFHHQLLKCTQSANSLYIMASDILR